MVFADTVTAAGKHIYEENTGIVSYKTHSAVIKRIKRIEEAYQKYVGADPGVY